MRGESQRDEDAPDDPGPGPESSSAHRQFVENLAERYRAPLMSYFLRRVRSPAEAEDLTHDVFLRVMRRPDGTDIDNPEAFLFQTAANLLRDRVRKEINRERYVSESVVREPQVETKTPERVLQTKETLETLGAALAELNDKTRDIFTLHHLENMKYREIADLLGISFSAVEKHMVKALAHLTKRMRRP